MVAARRKVISISSDKFRFSLEIYYVEDIESVNEHRIALQIEHRS